jgi:cGMP-dependent protein kinase
VEKLYVVKMGDISLLKDGQPVSDPTWLREAGGFSFFGDVCLDAITRSPYTVNVKSEVAHVLSLPRRQLDSFLGAAGAGLSSRGEVLSALRRCKALAVGGGVGGVGWGCGEGQVGLHWG